MQVKILSEDTINKIAAGEVVERPASIVKELMENSLDAGATQIVVEVKGGGKTLIRITDNGQGMAKDDALLALERHATSKINKAADLESINTLGFRGEALPSIAAISRFLLITKGSGSPAATRLYNEGGKLLEVKEAGAPGGTMVEARNIFFNTPARRKFLRTNTTEMTNIINVFSNYVLIRPECSFKLVSDNKDIIEVFSKDTLLDRIRVLYDKETADNLVPLDLSRGRIKLTGYVSKPTFTKSNRATQLFFVNNRPVSDRGINYAISSGYEHLVPRGRFPLIFLFLQMPSQEVDVNVHPGKREVRFSNARILKEIVREGIMGALGVSRPVIEPPSHFPRQKINGPASAAPAYFPEEKEKESYQPANLWKTESAREQAWLPQEAVSAGFQLAQMNNAYIICEKEDGFDIIDQHAIHERILYEKIKKDLNSRHPVSQRLLMPVMIEVSAAQEQILRGQLPFLAELGFNAEEFGKRSIKIDMIPAYLDKVDIARLIKDMLSEIAEVGKAAAQKEVAERLLKIMACRAAVKQGDKLDRLGMKRLVNEWRRLPQPYTCPHGRPAVIEMKKSKLDKQFRRS